MAAAIQAADVRAAARELERMKSSLRGWLRYRLLNDAVAAGKAPSKIGTAAAAQIVASQRDMQYEQKIASLLSALLAKVSPGVALPADNVAVNPNAAVELALIALGKAQAQMTSPTPQGGFLTGGPPWMWPVLIVGGVLLGVTVAIKSYTDIAKDREHYACIKAGACTDYGFWLKWAAIIGGSWFVWEKVGVGARVKALVAGKK